MCQDHAVTMVDDAAVGYVQGVLHVLKMLHSLEMPEAVVFSQQDSQRKNGDINKALIDISVSSGKL